MSKSTLNRRRKAAEGESFAERVGRLADELKLAVKWNRPSILFAVYQSYFVMVDAQEALAEQLRTIGQDIERYVVSKDNADIPLQLSEHPRRSQTVFFVQGLQFGGEPALRALNIRREYLVNNSIRAVFWLTEYEATAVAHGAPDFWAFRHRTVDFMDLPEPRRAAEVGRELAWTGADGRALLKDTDDKIVLRQRLLQDLPRTAETLGARAELQSTLAELYSAKGDFEEAIPYWQETIENKELLGDARGLALAYGGLARAYVGLGRFDQAIQVYHQAIALEPRLAVNHNALGYLYFELGRYDDAIAAYKRAAEIDPNYADPHNGIGNVYAQIGRFDAAVAEYERALVLDPKLVSPRNSLGYLYLHQGALERAESEFQAAKSVDDGDWRADFNLGLVRLQQGRIDEARALWLKSLSLCQGSSLLERLSRALLAVAVGRTERGLVEMRSLLGKPNLPLGTLSAVLRDAELLASATNPPRSIGEIVELLRERITQGALTSAGKPT
jgi:tetratricopeptide (TPR) repeat protein